MSQFIQLPLLFALIISLSACSIFSRDDHEEPKAEVNPPPAEEEIVYAETVTTQITPQEWSYEGDLGPEAWGDLKPEYALCKTGTQQSPVDLIYKKPRTDRPINVNYQETSVRVIDDGHTVQIHFDEGNSVEIEGVTYALTHARFHTSSEHTISGVRLPMEIQLVHQTPSGEMAILSTFLIEGPSHPVIESLWQNVPIQKGVEKELSFKINPSDLIPTTRTYYNYTGSLTQPPCTEGVNWNVFNTPITLSKEQILTFRKLYPNNSRPLQPLNERSTTNYL